MSAASIHDAGDVALHLAPPERKGVLRVMTCGSVDDGKSTLIGRLLYESRFIYADHLSALEADSRKTGTQGGELDLALVVDGLLAERELGITIDVAYRYFSTDRRTYIVADAPGHEQYTRNMVTAASTADLAVILVDARKGVLRQTRQHAHVASLLGIRTVVLAVNKMDSVSYSQAIFDAIVAEYQMFASRLLRHDFVAIPLSALRGDNVTTESVATSWYHGPCLMEYLETVEVTSSSVRAGDSFRMPVQWVCRPNQDFRGFAGLLVGGVVRPGDRVRAMPSAQTSCVTRIVTRDGDLEQAVAGQSVMLTVADEIAINRGDLLVHPASSAFVADRLQATIIWMDEESLFPGRRYLLKCGTATVTASITGLQYAVAADTLEHHAATELQFNEIGVCDIALDRAIAFDRYDDNRDTGSFILIDRLRNDTVGAGLIRAALSGRDLRWQTLEVGKEARARQKGQRPCVLWFTGLSGAGKTTIADLVEKRLHDLDHHTYLLDGDNVRHGLNRDLGFSAADRVENIRRVAQVAHLMVDAGLIVLVAFISPFRAERRLARELVGPGEFVEIFVDTPLEEAERRDPKGLYRKARRGELEDFTGIDSPYEAPLHPEIRIDTTRSSPDEAAEHIIDWLRAAGVGVHARSRP